MEPRLAYERLLEEGRSKREAMYESLKAQMWKGGLTRGERLPSTRRMAELYGISRGTVSQVYDMLQAEGYVDAEQGSGTYVAYEPAGGLHREKRDDSNRIAKERSGTSNLTPSASGLSSISGQTPSASGLSGPSFLLPSGSGSPEPDSPLPDISEPSAPSSLLPRAPLPRAIGQPQPLKPPAEPGPVDHGSRLPSGGILASPWFQRLEAAAPTGAEEQAIRGRSASSQRFASGQTDFRLFPAAEWKQALHAAVRQSMERPLADGYRELEAAGSLELRTAIAALLRRERGIQAVPEEIVVTSGSKQALALLLQTLAGPGDRFVMENPGYGGIREAALAAGAQVLGAEVDEHGIVPEDWDGRLAAVTPNRQFPTGAVLPASRRAELLAWAERRGALLVEDDYDGEFRYTGRPGEPLKAMDAHGRVVYLGSFSRTMYSGLRIGYAVAPPWLASRLVRAKSFYEPYSSGQLSALHRGLASLPGQPFRWSPAHAGLHQYAVWKAGEESYERLLMRAQELGVGWSDGRKYRVAEPAEARRPEPGALFGFAHLTEEEIAAGMERLAEAWRSARKE
ncbi:PLP-dependent aminotransferase family protein [Paenibacillus albicereus]|uniref:PLP-dependent aminotransferase family protein n=1 Tax=Paenibacillus albicereus TaxID=2726185 RepID=A0A6H2GVG2_9BACL|nr:PLP-dependent aminotransferase family protein [Paenibacillus albicereus]QJC51385.1 PLP-dependent aminotransferase family protein [Paenibacillus albicereus]